MGGVSYLMSSVNIVSDAGEVSGEEPPTHLHPETERLPGPSRHSQGKMEISLFTTAMMSHCNDDITSIQYFSVLSPVCHQKFRRRVQESTQMLRELEISLRTNHIGYLSVPVTTCQSL